LFKLKIVRREDAQTEFETVDPLCIICGGGFESFVWSISPTLIIVPIYSNKRNKVETNKGSASLISVEPKTLYYYFYCISVIIY
jgi:hypothetical protein